MNSSSQTDPVSRGVLFDPASDAKAATQAAAVRVDQLERQITQSNVVWGVWAIVVGVLFAAGQLWNLARGTDRGEIQSYSIPKDASLQASGFVRFQPTPPLCQPGCRHTGTHARRDSASGKRAVVFQADGTSCSG